MSGLTVAVPNVSMDESARVNLDLNLGPPLIPVPATVGAGERAGSTPDLGIRQEARAIWLPGVRVLEGFMGGIRGPSGSELLPSNQQTRSHFQSLQQMQRRSLASREQPPAVSHRQFQLQFGLGQAQPDQPVLEQVGISAGSRVIGGQAPSQQMPQHPRPRQRLMRRFQPARRNWDLVQNNPRTGGSLNFFSLSESSVSPAVSHSLVERQKLVAETSGSNFECNICLEMACEPVVTPCGHLFCWPCLHHWLQLWSSHQECPVCKGEISPSSLTPIYGRGTESSTKISSSETGTSSLPPRPPAHRVESQRQRADRDEGERERVQRVRVNDFAVFHRRLVPLFPVQRDPDDLLDRAEQLVRATELAALQRSLEAVPIFPLQRDPDEVTLDQVERQISVTELTASERRLEAVPVFPMQREPSDFLTRHQSEQQARDDVNIGMSLMRDEMLNWGRAAHIWRESLNDTLQTRSSVIGDLRDRVGTPFGGHISDPMSSNEEQGWQFREAARSAEAEEIRQVERRMRQTAMRLARERNEIISRLAANRAEATGRLAAVQARLVGMNSIAQSYQLPYLQQPAQSQIIEVVPPILGGDRSTGLPPVHEQVMEIGTPAPGGPALTPSVDRVQVISRRVAAREALVRQRQSHHQENVPVLLESRQDSSETVGGDGAAASSEAGGTLLHFRKRRRLD